MSPRRAERPITRRKRDAPDPDDGRGLAVADRIPRRRGQNEPAPLRQRRARTRASARRPDQCDRGGRMVGQITKNANGKKSRNPADCIPG